MPAYPFVAIALTLAFFAVMLSGSIIHRARPDSFNKRWFQNLAHIGGVTTAFWVTFFFISTPFDIMRVVLYNSPKFSEIYQNLYLGIFILAGGLSSYGLLVVLRGPKVKEVTVPIDNLAPALRGLKITQISDLHVGSTLRKKYVEEVVRRVNETHPDLLFLTGDIADAHLTSINEDLKPLENLKSRYGTFYITGNHEYYWNAEDLIAKAKELGFRALLNENAIIRVGDSKLMVAGVTDPMGEYLSQAHRPDMKKAIA